MLTKFARGFKPSGSLDYTSKSQSENRRLSSNLQLICPRCGWPYPLIKHGHTECKAGGDRPAELEEPNWLLVARFCNKWSLIPHQLKELEKSARRLANGAIPLKRAALNVASVEGQWQDSPNSPTKDSYPFSKLWLERENPPPDSG